VGVAQRLVLTGAGGFLGRNCLDALRGQEWEIHAVDRGRPPGGVEIEWHEVDLLQGDAGRRLIERLRPTHLLHLAWTGARPVYDSPDNGRWVAASMALFESFAAAGGERMVGIGSSAEYDWSYGLCREEETPLSTASAYSAAKVELGRRFLALCHEQGVSGAWARPFFLFGRYEHPSRFVASIVVSLLRGEAARCTHGRQVRDYLYAGEAASALARLLAVDFAGVVNVASGRPVALADLARAVARRLGGEAVLDLGALPPPAGEAPTVVADIERLSRDVGWRPARSLGESLDETIRWWTTELADRSSTGEES
jgi:nucleoside-diphosphate-sugar epimerase